MEGVAIGPAPGEHETCARASVSRARAALAFPVPVLLAQVADRPLHTEQQSALFAQVLPSGPPATATDPPVCPERQERWINLASGQAGRYGVQFTGVAPESYPDLVETPPSPGCL